jgi:[acyl-carrier-protein] S-malonyltransferase
MPTPVFLLFPGQGAQQPGMARDVYEAGGYATALFDEAAEVLGFDLKEMIFHGDAMTLAKTENCQPALLVASLALLATLRERRSVEIRGAAGLSLGEYTALVALESIDFADAVRLVRRRGELMEEAGRGRESGMLSILGLESVEVERIAAEAADAGLVVPANYNAPGQLVLSGETPALEKAARLAKEAGARRAIPLKVSAAFHSPVMEPARHALLRELQDVPVRPPSGLFVNNADARALIEPDMIREALARQLVSPVRWEQSMRFVTGEGASTFFEVGPGTVCKGLMRRIAPEAEVTTIHSLETIEQLP